MAMTKKEKEYMDKIETRLALRFTDPVTRDVPIPDFGAPLSTGFLYNSYSRKVAPACSSSISHSFGRNDKTTTQEPAELYSTKLRALKAMRNEMEIHFASILRTVDKQIEQESNNTQ